MQKVADGNGGVSRGILSLNLANENRTTTRVTKIRLLLLILGLISITYSIFQFESHFKSGLDSKSHGGRVKGNFVRENKEKPKDSAAPPKTVTTAPTARTRQKHKYPPPPPLPVHHEGIVEKLPSNTLPSLPNWPIPNDSAFNKTDFEQNYNTWKAYRGTVYRYQQQSKLQYAFQNPKTSSNSTLSIIPHLHQIPMFQRHLSWDLMVVVMADNLCPLISEDGQLNSVVRLLTTLRDALMSNVVHVTAYLPHYYHEGESSKCHNQLFEAIVSAFPAALRRGQLQIVTSPQLEQDRGDAYRWALNGLDFAYAAELGHTYADLIMFLQAGSTLVSEWWMQQPPQISDGNSTRITSNRDYGVEIMLGYENRQRYDEKGLNHQLCYINFARDLIPGDFMPPENPTGVLWERNQLKRFALTLRSYAPYGTNPVSRILQKYCKDLLWEALLPDADLLLFEYHPIQNNETLVVPLVQNEPIPNTTTFPYLKVAPKEVPSWVTIPSSIVGPQPPGEANPLLRVLDSAIPTAITAVQSPPLKEQHWMTFAIPTAWRHTVSGEETKGNTYVVNCVKQLASIIYVSFNGNFGGKYRANILLLVSGQDASDIAHHRAGLEVELASDIRRGIVRLVDAPIEQYPTLHGLDPNFQDKEQRVRWRSKQNLDISAALFAAKGLGKYIMVIEDDSEFDASKLFNGIRQQIANLHRQYNPGDAVEFNPRVFVNGGDQRRFRANYNEGHDPAETDMGHRELWSQIRFSFGYSGVLIHDEDAFVFGMLHYLLYQEKPCDLSFEIADMVRILSKDHFLRFNKKARFISHAGKVSTLEGKVFTDEQIAKG